MIELVGSLKYKKVYICGPITGIANENRDEFQRYSKKFSDLGFETINPHDLFTKEEVEDLKIRCFIKNEITEKELWATFMKRDLPEMFKCDFVAVLHGWEKSKGANLEIHNAKELYMPVVSAETLIELF